MDENTLTPQEEQELSEIMGGSYPQAKEATGIIGFFKKILGLVDTSKAGNLDADELNSVRMKQEAGLYAETMGFKEVANYFNGEAEVVLGTSLSKDGFFITQANTQKRTFQSETNQGGKTKFKRK